MAFVGILFCSVSPFSHPKIFGKQMLIYKTPAPKKCIHMLIYICRWIHYYKYTHVTCEFFVSQVGFLGTPFFCWASNFFPLLTVDLRPAALIGFMELLWDNQVGRMEVYALHTLFILERSEGNCLQLLYTFSFLYIYNLHMYSYIYVFWWIVFWT